MRSDGEITTCIHAARTGEPGARDRLYELVYDDLKRIAFSIPGVSDDGGTMPPTALVHHVFIELDRRFPLPPSACNESRATFYHSVALAMRTIVRDYGSARNAQKRGGGRRPVGLDEAHVPAGKRLDLVDYIALDSALDHLMAYNKRWYDVVMLKHFAGRTIAEIASWRGVGASTIIADWNLARSWLRRELADVCHAS